MISFFKLIRLPNLLIMAFTQYMVRWCVVLPVLALKRSDLQFSLLESKMSELDFFLLVLSTVMIGAAGYIINDYFDVRIDEVNRPKTNVVGKGIKRRVAMGAHMVINILGAGIGIWLSWKYGMFRVGSFIYITAPALLWFYSTNLKRQFLAGNLVIALLSGLVPMMVILFDLPNISREFPDLVQSGLLNLSDIVHVTFMVAVFAFSVSFLREMIKDTEDYEGDLAYGCKTAPIVLGIARTKWIMAALAAFVIGLLGWLELKQFKGVLLPPEFSLALYLYFFILLQLPLAFLVYRLLKAKTKQDWKFASLLVKIVMVAGISYLFLYAHGINSLIENAS
ncbi:MAG TPA: geranylgeranylglycerol-phosphate geranylgeranyltransferase [Bacteroidia bacterium]|nr:geranylgeranylglycerol-phosphate geranylgeranyltransferase [Bacteroidia bacterium]